MNIEKIRHFFLLSQDESLWDDNAWHKLRDPSSFLIVNWGEETAEIITLWNKIVPEEFSISAVSDSAQTPAGFTDHLSCNGRTLDVPYRASREDCFLVVLTINNLLKEDIELRLSKASTGGSDWIFMPLRPKEWSSLETQYGSDQVDTRFVRLPDEWEKLTLL